MYGPLGWKWWQINVGVEILLIQWSNLTWTHEAQVSLFWGWGSSEYFGILSCPMCSHQVSKCVPQHHLHFHLHVFTWFKMNLHGLTLSTLTYPRLSIYIHECWCMRGFTVTWNVNKFLIYIDLHSGYVKNMYCRYTVH